MLARAVLIAAAVLTSPAAHDAQAAPPPPVPETATAAYWFEKCTNDHPEKLVRDIAFFSCAAMMRGYVEGVMPLQEAIGVRHVCLPRQLAMPALASVWVSWLRQRPDMMQRHVGASLLFAFRELFPCAASDK